MPVLDAPHAGRQESSRGVLDQRVETPGQLEEPLRAGASAATGAARSDPRSFSDSRGERGRPSLRKGLLVVRKVALEVVLPFRACSLPDRFARRRPSNGDEDLLVRLLCPVNLPGARGLPGVAEDRARNRLATSPGHLDDRLSPHQQPTTPGEDCTGDEVRDDGIDQVRWPNSRMSFRTN